MSDGDRYPLPKGWVWRALGDVGTVASGGTPSTKVETNFGGENAWLTPADLSDFSGKRVSGGSRTLSADGLSSSSAKLLPKETVLFSSRAPIGYVAIADGPIATNQGFKNLIPGPTVSSDYVFHYLKANRRLAESYASGSTFKELSATRFRKIPIPVPPISEQHLIVEKLEELLSDLDAGISDLIAAKQKIQQYRKSVLQAAVEGRLTAPWRRKHDTESADVLLERMFNEIEQNKYKRQGKMTRPDTSLQYDLPVGWRWAQVGDLAHEICYGTSDKASYDNSGVAMLRMGNLTENGRIQFDDLKFMPANWGKKGKSLLQDGDVLFNRTNSAELVGKTAVYRHGRLSEVVFASYLICVRVMSNYYLPELISYFVNSSHGRRYINTVVSQQVGQANVNASKLSSMSIPVPPIQEQSAIVGAVQKMESVADSAAETVDRELTRAERLRQSILEKAFRGELLKSERSDVTA